MTTTYIDATDEIKKRVFDAWNAATLAVTGERKKMFFQGAVRSAALELGDADDYWARTSIQTVDQTQSVLRGVEGARESAIGLVFVQMFFPVSEPTAWRNGSTIAAAVRKSFARRTESGTVWFRGRRINELGLEGTHHRLNVVAEFEYDEVV